MIKPEILQILVCPETRQPLTEAPADLVAKLNAQITQGSLKNRAGEPVTQPIDSALIRADAQYAYPIRNNLPILLIDQALPIAS